MTFRAAFPPSSGVSGRACARAAAVLLAALFATAPPVAAAPFVWDDNDDQIDDRVESVQVLGYRWSFENGDTLLRQRIGVVRSPAGSLVYSVYVVFDHDPTETDLLVLNGLGMPVLNHYRNVPAVRSIASFAQIQQAAMLSGVERVEALPVIYPVDREGNAAIGERDPSSQVFPTAELLGAPSGQGVVVAILDSGVNDQADGSYPGHEALRGACLGGAQFFGGDSSLDTPRTGSINPIDRGGIATQSHGTHVAGIALGRGGSTGYATGVAPAAYFVDVKTISDAGLSTSLPEALDWCIHNRLRDWGAGPGLTGIDVINMSLSSVDYSDGNDVAARLAQRASQLGIVVVGSVGNDGKSGWIPSPASGDGVLAVGAIDDQRTPLTQDDLYGAFNNYGPRVTDGDGDTTDEQKPDLLAPGVGILAPNGDLGTDGSQYRRLTGTSMAAAFVSGAAAVLRSADPSLTPGQIGDLLRSTALRTVTGPAAPGGPDPRWNAATGWGVVDLHAAWIELQQPARSQIRRLTLTSTPTTVTGLLWTQRELGAAYYVFERAPDVAGAPGEFAAIDSVAATGDGSLLDDDLQAYSRTWAVPPDELGATFWYRIAYTEGGTRWVTLANRFVQPTGPSVATLEVTIVHNAYDSDITGAIVVNPGTVESHVGGGGESAISFSLPASSAAVASDWVSGTTTTGNISWTFQIEVPAGVAESYLPPTAQNSWWLSVDEGGYLNRSGRLTDYKLIDHAPGGDVVYQGGPLPRQTVEGQTVNASIPQGLVAVEGPSARPTLTVGPNPIAAGGTVTFALRSPGPTELRIYDLAGRQIGRAPMMAGSEGRRAEWSARGADGSPLPAGLYFARAGDGLTSRVVVIAR